jgi:hypothetical protein
MALAGSSAEVTLDIRADVPDGVPDLTVRTVTENCRTLKFREHGFEAEKGLAERRAPADSGPARCPSGRDREPDRQGEK